MGELENSRLNLMVGKIADAPVMTQIVESNIKGALEKAKSWKHLIKNIKILSIDMGPTKH